MIREEENKNSLPQENAKSFVIIALFGKRFFHCTRFKYKLNTGKLNLVIRGHMYKSIT